MAGNGDLCISTLASDIPFVRKDRLRPLAVATERRASVLPDVPTMQEAGIVGYTYEPGTASRYRAQRRSRWSRRVNAIVVRAIQSPQVKAQVEQVGIEPVTTTPQQFAAFIRTNPDKWGGMVRAAGLAKR